MGTPGSPLTRLTVVPDKLVRPTRRPVDLSVGPTNLVGGSHDLLKSFQKIPQTTLSRREDSFACKTRQSRRIKATRVSFPCCNWLEIGFPVVTDLDSGPPTLSITQYKASKGALLGSRPSTPWPCNPTWDQSNTNRTRRRFYSPEARNSIKFPCPCVLL
jgi:hypothetical protein